jgi:hypothetical protein
MNPYITRPSRIDSRADSLAPMVNVLITHIRESLGVQSPALDSGRFKGVCEFPRLDDPACTSSGSMKVRNRLQR